MNESIKFERSLDQLGLPPMELAESSTNDSNRTSTCIYKCLYTSLQKVFFLLLLITFSAGTYILLMKLLESSDNNHSTEIILVTGTKETANITLHKKNMDIFFQLYNKTSEPNLKRKKRSAIAFQRNILDKLNKENLEKVKEIILEHKTLCRNKEKSHVCDELITKLKNVVDKNENEFIASQIHSDAETKYLKVEDTHQIPIAPTEVKKRETNPLAKIKAILGPTSLPIDNHSTNASPHSHTHIPGTSSITDTCLLAKLLKQNYPNVHGIFDNPVPSYVSPDIDHLPAPHARYYQPSLPYLQTREFKTRETKLHPQDLDIIMNFLHPKPEESKLTESNATTRSLECSPETRLCDNGAQCIEHKLWCDGQVDCLDSSDETRCNCKSRVDRSRLCDGYFDCPLGEDEMGCYGCSENAFSCGDFSMNSQMTCFSKEQRCNNIVDCSNNRDEIDCNILTPGLLKKPMFAVSSTEGFLHRNFKGDWYAVCQNPYMWAHDACRRETGLMMRPPFIEIVPIDPLLKIHYLNTAPEGLIHQSDTCFNNSAVYVTCPDFLCGVRVSTTSGLLKESAENNLFGRNKRFLLPNHQYNPYHVLYYGKRMKRDAAAEEPFESVDSNKIESVEDRSKRAESRVVGGKPSKPAAWPWMVAMYRDGMFHCGGVILTQSWVISAAHCVHKFWDHYYEIQVGMLRRFSFSPQEQIHRVTHIIVNQHYRPIDMKNDLSLLKVEPSIQFSRWVRPICLPSVNTAGPDWLWGPAPGTICTAVGWGATAEHGPDPDHMREVEVPVWKDCKHREDIAGKEICAGLMEGGKDACQGDSGGPLLCRNPLNTQQWYLAGIVSHGDGCGRKDEPGVYTRVSLFVKWIKYHTSTQTLPLVQPIQECPGYKCSTGILKCLPTSRKCDKIVDCLNAEDEMNCDFTIIRNDAEEKSTENNAREPENKSLSSETTTSNILLNVTNETSTTVATVNNSTNSDKNLIKKTSGELDFAHASTLEIAVSTSKSTEESNSISEESVTADPKMSSDSTEFDRGDMQTIEVSLPRGNLESRSFVKETPEKNLDLTSTTQRSEDLELLEVTTSTFSKMEDLDIMASNTIEQPTNTTNNSGSLVITFLPDKLTNSSEISQENVTSLINELTTEGLSAKNLPEAESKSIINKVEELVFSELPSAIRKKHHAPKVFECRRILQMIPFNQRCDHKADCEDGSDELECNCMDYLTSFDENLICDGVLDCANGEDEIDCYSCPEQHFLCKRSEICLPMKYVCDGKPQCPSGEDEFNCFALTNGKEILYDIDEKPRIRLEGYLTERHKNNWQVVCEDNLSVEQQEQAATHICHYLGFSAPNRFSIKYVNVNEDILKANTQQLSFDGRKRRNAGEGQPIQFLYRDVREDNKTARNFIITEPEVLKEKCVPNVTKTCKSLYVCCDRSLYTDLVISQDLRTSEIAENSIKSSTLMLPWIAKIYLEGEYKCTGILVDESWVLISDSCLWETTSTKNFVTVVLGSQRTLKYAKGYYERVHNVDSIKYLYRNRVALLHLENPAEYSNMVKPMILSSSNFNSDKNTICVAVGQDSNNNTVSIFLKETNKNCNPSNRCFVREGYNNICGPGEDVHRQWSGLISCHNKQGWLPAASFVESTGECGLGESINATDIENLRFEIKDLSEQFKKLEINNIENSCEDGVRCSRGVCIPFRYVCDNIKHCEDGNDETKDSCKIKHETCAKNPFGRGCECATGQLKCWNGKCVAKELFGDGKDDCGDGSDEPKRSLCSDYLARAMPSRLCDGILHCHDRSDEDPMFCKCFAKKSFQCNSKLDDIDHCVALDMVCDGIRDCPNGEDERTCIGLSAPTGTPHGTGQVIIQSHGVWRSKCYPTQQHTKSELEAICRELGYISGHAKEIKDVKQLIVNSHNNIALGQFDEVSLNNHTTIKIRNTNEPLAKAILDHELKDCFPVFIECV